MNKLAGISNFGRINQPTELAAFGNVESGGIGNLMNLAFNIIIVVAGIYALINIILAGYKFLNAGNDPKKIKDATAQIWQSILGVGIVAGAFIIAALIGVFVFGSATAVLQPVIKAP